MIVVFINSWMVQAVFINRYGRTSWTDVGIAFVDMMILLFMSNAFSESLNTNLQPFFIAAGFLSLTLVLQYLIVYSRTHLAVDKRIAGVFVLILGIRTIALLVAGAVTLKVGVPVALVGVMVSWIAPSFTGLFTRQHPIIFSHLLERLTLLTIIVFGETIVGIAAFFTREAISVTSILIFAIIASLFFTYITEFDHLIDEHRSGETGNLLIYLHYPIIFGLSMVTVAVRFISEPDANMVFSVSFLYAGIGLMQFGIWTATRYNKAEFSTAKQLGWWFSITTVVGFVVCLLLANFFTIVVVTAIATISACAGLVKYLADRVSVPQ